MADYIDIDTPIDVAVYQRNRRIQVTLRQILDNNDAKYQPADVREVKRGVWCPIPIDEEGVNFFACSNCKYEVFISVKAMELVGFEEPHFCPNCGADMREEQT